MIKILIFLLISIFQKHIKSNEIIIDKNGNYFLIKKDGTYQELPAPKPGNKYVIKKRVIHKKEEKKIFKRPVKKSRTRTNQGFK